MNVAYIGFPATFFSSIMMMWENIILRCVRILFNKGFYSYLILAPRYQSQDFYLS